MKFLKFAIPAALLQLVSANDDRRCYGIQISACSFSQGYSVGFISKNNEASAVQYTVPGWYTVYKKEQGATVYAYLNNCTKPDSTPLASICNSRVRVVYGNKFNATFIATKENVAGRTNYLDYYRPKNFADVIDSNFVSLRPKHTTAEMTFGDNTELILSVKPYDTTIDILITTSFDSTGKYDRTGQNNTVCAKSSTIEVSPFANDELMEADFADSASFTPLSQNSMPLCYAMCATMTDDYIRPFVVKSAKSQTGNYKDSRVGWIHMIDSVGFRVAVRQNLCLNADDQLSLCTDRARVSYSNQFLEFTRNPDTGLMEMSIEAAAPETPTSPYRLRYSCMEEKCVVNATIESFVSKVIISPANYYGSDLVVVLSIPYSLSLNNTNQACGAIPSTNAVTSPVERAYIRTFNMNFKTATLKELNNIGIQTEGISNTDEKMNADSPCFFGAARPSALQQVEVVTNQGSAAGSNIAFGDTCIIDMFSVTETSNDFKPPRLVNGQVVF